MASAFALLESNKSVFAGPDGFYQVQTSSLRNYVTSSKRPAVGLVHEEQPLQDGPAFFGFMI